MNKKISDLLNKGQIQNVITDFSAHGATIILKNSYCRTILATALAMMIASYHAQKNQKKTFIFMNYMYHDPNCEGEVMRPIHSTKQHDAQCHNAEDLLLSISDDSNPKIHLTRYDTMQIMVAMGLFVSAVKGCIPKEDFTIVSHVLDGITKISMSYHIRLDELDVFGFNND